MRRGEKKKQGMRNTQVVYATWVIWVYSNQLERVTASRPTSAQSPGFLSGFSVNVRTYNMSGPSSSHSSWNEMKFSLTSICTQRWITPREKKRKKKKIPPTLLMLWEPVWLGEPYYLSLVFWLVSLHAEDSSHLFSLLKVSEVASEDHGRRNSPCLRSHPRGLWELHLHADQWPADPAHSFCQPHSDAYVSVCAL